MAMCKGPYCDLRVEIKDLKEAFDFMEEVGREKGIREQEASVGSLTKEEKIRREKGVLEQKALDGVLTTFEKEDLLNASGGTWTREHIFWERAIAIGGIKNHIKRRNRLFILLLFFINSFIYWFIIYFISYPLPGK